MTTTTDKPSGVLTRGQQRVEDTWNLDLVFPTLDAWEEAFGRIDAMVAPLLALRGQLDSPAKVAELLRAEDALHQLVEKVYVHAHLREDEDTGVSENQARMQRVKSRYAQVSAQLAWIRPEILSQPLETLEAWRDAAELAGYRYYMTVLIREKPHTLSEPEERLLSMASEVLGNPQQTFGYLNNADLKFPDVIGEDGQPHPLTHGRYITFLESRDRDVRRRAFEGIYDTFSQFKNTFASTLSGNVKRHTLNARVRGFGSALEASLHPDNVPVTLYDGLIGAVHDALPAFHEYVALRRRMLGVEDLDMWDQHVAIVPDFELKVDWDEACRWVADACGPMGEEYLGGVRDCFSKRWIDVYENKGKRSGAYSSGCYGTPPYILMNYQGTLDHVFTLAHELGHSMHSWLANRTQPYRFADYKIFVAEIASTTNEALLLHHLLETTTDPRFRAYLLNHLCDSFRGTVYRQTMFAEFEKMIHAWDAEGKPLTADALCDAYYELNARFYGPQVKADRRIAFEWARIPHFYYNFYVYKYATGFCASQIFSRRILADAGQREQYLDFLRSGGSADPLDLVRRGGVDLTDRAVLTDAFETFSKAVGELGDLLDSGL